MKENEKLIFNWREEHDFWIKQREYHRINKKGGRKTNRENEIINKKKKQQNGKKKKKKKRREEKKDMFLVFLFVSQCGISERCSFLREKEQIIINQKLEIKEHTMNKTFFFSLTKLYINV